MGGGVPKEIIKLLFYSIAFQKAPKQTEMFQKNPTNFKESLNLKRFDLIIFTYLTDHLTAYSLISILFT